MGGPDLTLRSFHSGRITNTPMTTPFFGRV